MYYESGNLLLKKTRFDEGELDRALGALLDLPVVPVPPTAVLLVGAGRIGRRHDVSFYDASFVALSVELGCPFVTADERLLGRLRGLNNVIPLSRIELLAR